MQHTKLAGLLNDPLPLSRREFITTSWRVNRIGAVGTMERTAMKEANR